MSDLTDVTVQTTSHHTPTMTTAMNPDWTLLDTITLDRGGHESPESGMCALEAVAYITREPFSDHPACVSPVVAEFARSWNDALNAEDRNRLLKPILPQLVGTATTPDDEEARAWLATDWLCRVQTPAWLRLAGLTAEAQALESCARIVDAVTARAAQPALDAARTSSTAAWAAAGDAAWDAAGDAARAAARDAARAAAGAAAGDAAWDAAGDAAWDAARAAARDAAWTAAWAAARAAARAAAWAAAWAAAGDAAWDAAGDAAWDKLRPVVETLQASALDLLRDMCNVGRVEAVA